MKSVGAVWALRSAPVWMISNMIHSPGLLTSAGRNTREFLDLRYEGPAGSEGKGTRYAPWCT